MGDRSWTRRLAVAAAVAVLAGCGGRFPLPTELKRTTLAGKGIYQMIATWTGKDGVRDLLLTQGVGSQLLMLMNNGGSDSTERGEVRPYSRTSGNPIGPRFPGLFNPVALASGGDGALFKGNRIYVLDQGDSCMARTNLATGRCDSTRGSGKDPWGNRLTRRKFYWKVVEYDLLGTKMSAFTDSMMAFVDGIAADENGNVFVAGLAIVKIPTIDPRLTERTFGYRVWRYARGSRPDGTPDPTVLPPDPEIPSSPWHRDADYEIRQGTGVGATIEPRGIYWSPAAGPALFIADLGNFRIEKVRDGNARLPEDQYYQAQDLAHAPALIEPLDVTADLAGSFYAVDATAARVYRYSDPARAFIQRVDEEPNAFKQPLQRPVAVAADSDYAYVADLGAGQVIRYQRRK